MQDLSLLVIDEGQQYRGVCTDREIAVISLLKQQPLVLWTGDSQQTARRHCPGGTQCQKISPAPVGQKTRTTQDRNYYMPSNLGEAMIRLLDHSSNEGLAILSQVLRKGEHALGNLWTGQLSQQSRSGPPRGKYGPSRPRCTVPSCPAE